MKASFNLLVLIIISLHAAAFAQTPSAAPGSLESILAIEEPMARIAALQKFLKTNSIVEQGQTAREAIVASYAQVGETQLGENNIERAVEEFRKAMAGIPDKITDQFFEETLIRIPLAVSIRGYRNEAISLAQQLEKRFAKEPPRLGRLGEFYLTIEAPNDAIRTLEAASRLADEEAAYHRALAAAYRMGLRLDDAVSEYQLAVNSDARDKRAYYEMANLYRAHGAYNDAIKLYQKQVSIEPKHTPSYKGMALAYLAMGREDDATAALNQARDIRGSLEELTGDIYLQTQLAFHYLAQSKLKQARQAADAALAIEPRYAWARIAAAEIDMAEGKYFDAERHLLAAKSFASFPTLFFTLGKLYLSVEDFDGAQEQFTKAFTYSQQNQFTTRLGGTFDVQADNLKDLLSREHQAAIFLAQPPTTDEQFKISESLVKFNTRLKLTKMPPVVNRPPIRGKQASPPPPAASESVPNSPEARRKLLEDLDQAAMSFIEAENVRRSFRMLYIAERLANAGVATGLAIELADQSLGLAEVATEYEGSVREYPNYDRNGRLNIFRGRALDAKGWALFKAGKNQEAVSALSEAVQAYGSLPENKRAIWHLATVKESQGEWKEALDLYIAGYEPPANPNLDINRAVVESIYRKVNGSLEGLDKLIGPSLVATAASAPVPASSKGREKEPKEPKAPRPAGKKTAPGAALVALNTQPESASKEFTGTAIPATLPKTAAPVSTAFPVPIVPPPIDQPEPPTAIASAVEPAPPPKPKPIELPTVLFPDTFSARIFATGESPIFPSEWLPPAMLTLTATETELPPAPAPRVHTRKRRVTSPESVP